MIARMTRWLGRLTIAATVTMLAGSAVGQVVSGTVRLSTDPALQTPLFARRGYVRFSATAAAAESFIPQPFTVFLRWKDGTTVPKTEPQVIRFEGLAFQPAVAACEVGGQVQLVNADIEPVTFRVEDAALEPVPPGETRLFDCDADRSGEMRLSVVEWPVPPGLIYVAASGAPASVDADGRFKVRAARGTYVLQVVTTAGVRKDLERPVEVETESIRVEPIELPPGGR